MTELEALARRLNVEENWLVPWQKTLAPGQVDCREAIIRLILPARILRKVRYQKRLDAVTKSTEFIHCVCASKDLGPASAKETQPKFWIDLIIRALDRTGYITKKQKAYAITPKGMAWLRMTAKFSLPLPPGVLGTDFDWTWRLWFHKPLRDRFSQERRALSCTA